MLVACLLASIYLFATFYILHTTFSYFTSFPRLHFPISNFYFFFRFFSLMVACLYRSMFITVRHFTCSIFICQLCYWYHFLLTYVSVFVSFFSLLFCSSSATLILIIEFWLICILSGYISFIHFYLLLIFLKLRILHVFFLLTLFVFVVFVFVGFCKCFVCSAFLIMLNVILFFLPFSTCVCQKILFFACNLFCKFF